MMSDDDAGDAVQVVRLVSKLMIGSKKKWKNG